MRNIINKNLSIGIIGAALGVCATYFMDPRSGKRRRAYARDKTKSGISRLGCTLQDRVSKLGRNMANRVSGLRVRVRNYVSAYSEPIPDDKLIARVRSKLGRLVAHPHSVDVKSHDGEVVLRGLVVEGEEEKVLCAVSAIPGVKEVINNLDTCPDVDFPLRSQEVHPIRDIQHH